MSNRLEYNGSYSTEVSVDVYWDLEEEYLLAYEDGDMQDGFDYEEYEERLNNGEPFEKVAEDIVLELQRQR